MSGDVEQTRLSFFCNVRSEAVEASIKLARQVTRSMVRTTATRWSRFAGRITGRRLALSGNSASASRRMMSSACRLCVDLVRSIGADRVVDYTKEDFTKLDERFDVIHEVRHDLATEHGALSRPNCKPLRNRK